MKESRDEPCNAVFIEAARVGSVLEHSPVTRVAGVRMLE